MQRAQVSCYFRFEFQYKSGKDQLCRTEPKLQPVVIAERVLR